MNITNIKIATTILSSLVAIEYGTTVAFSVEEQERDEGSAYEGALLSIGGNHERFVCLYFCDDADAQQWMIDCCDFSREDGGGDVRPLPFTADALIEAIKWLVKEDEPEVDEDGFGHDGSKAERPRHDHY